MPKTIPLAWKLFLCTAYAAWISVETRRGVYHESVPLVLSVLSLISFVQYGYDKYVAVNKIYRVPELRLHFVDLLGGWPGGLLAQIFFRHKIRKRSFQGIFYCLAVLNVAILVRYGSHERKSWTGAP